LIATDHRETVPAFPSNGPLTFDGKADNYHYSGLERDSNGTACISDINIQSQQSLDFIGGDGSPILVRDNLESGIEVFSDVQDVSLADFNIADESLNEGHLVDVIARKKSCHCSWCDPCFIRFVVPKIKERISKMDWRRVRFIMLSIDRELFPTGQEAYEFIHTHKSVREMIHNLKRVAGIVVTDWFWFLEWHEDGFPHYHLLIETQGGKTGMIGGELLRKYWGLGRVTESFIKGEKHWRTISGYFEKRGYFNKDDKSHQVRLPEWARSYTTKIRRYGAMQINQGKKRVEIKITPHVQSTMDRPPCNKNKPYDLILESCGSEVIINIVCEAVELPAIKIEMNYKAFLEENAYFHYQQGIGFHVRVNWDQLEIILTRYRSKIKALVVDEELADFYDEPQ